MFALLFLASGEDKLRSYNTPVKIAIVDYGMANLRSVQKAFEAVIWGANNA